MLTPREFEQSELSGYGGEFGDGYGCGIGLDDFKEDCFAPGEANGKSMFSKWSTRKINILDYDGR